MAAKKEAAADTVAVNYMGGTYEVCKPALLSMKYQRKLANASRDLAGAFDAMDVILCGRLDEYVEGIPEPDGTVSGYGASIEAMNAFFDAASEQAAGAKN